MVTESELVSRGYLTTFFIDIDQLRNSLTGYRSMILRLGIDTTKEHTTEQVSKTVGDDPTRAALIQWADAVRNSVERCQISYSALITTIPTMKSEKLTEQYTKIIKGFCPDVNIVAEFTFEIHRCFIAGTLHEIMNRMDEFYQQYIK